MKKDTVWIVIMLIPLEAIIWFGCLSVFGYIFGIVIGVLLTAGIITFTELWVTFIDKRREKIAQAQDQNRLKKELMLKKFNEANIREMGDNDFRRFVNSLHEDLELEDQEES